MPIERIENNLIFNDLGITPSLGIESQRLDDCISQVLSKGYKGVFGTPSFGFNQIDLDFLAKLPDVIQLWFWDVKIKNIDGIYDLKGLKYFGVHDKRAAIDFSRFSELEFINWHPIRKDSGIDSLTKLKRINIWRWKPKDKSYGDIPIPSCIQRLDLNWCIPESLEEMPKLEMLTELQIHRSRNLKSITNIADVAPNLKRLVITGCPHIELGPEKDFLSKLNHAWIHNVKL